MTWVRTGSDVGRDESINEEGHGKDVDNKVGTDVSMNVGTR